MNSSPKTPTIYYIDLRSRTVIPPLEAYRRDKPWINIMLSGSAEYILNGEPVVLREGHAVYFRINDVVARNEQKSTVRYLSIVYDPNGEEYELDTLIPILGNTQKMLVETLQNYYFTGQLGDENNRIASEMIFWLLLREFESTCHEKKENIVREIRHFIQKNWSAGITTSDVAKAMSLNASYCNTLYKSKSGETVSEYISRLRVNHAKSKLAYSDSSVKEIANECGYKDPYYFSTFFRKKEGMSPSEYRRKSNVHTSAKYGR